MNLKAITIQYSHHHNKRSLFPHWNGSLYCSCFEGKRLKDLIKNWKGEIVIDETGEIKVKEERDMTSTNLSGPGQTMTTETYVTEFAHFINSDDTGELLKSLFCDFPKGLFVNLSPEDQLSFIHKLDSCVKTIKVYQQSAEINHRNKIESLDLEDRIKLKRKDQEYKIKPSKEESEKRDKETKLQKMVKMLRDMNISEEQIKVIVHGK